MRLPERMDQASSDRDAVSRPAGRVRSLSLPRRYIRDLMRVCRGIPLVSISRRMQLGELARARSAADRRIGWCALFLKAYAVVARRTPELRRVHFSFPSARLYEHPLSIASLAVSRDYRGEPAVLFGHVRAPDRRGLDEIEDCVQRLQQAPIESIGLFRRILAVSRLPGPLRRVMWWLGMNTSGRRRAKYFGTFGLSSVAGLGATLNTLISPCATTLTYGPVAEDGSIDVGLVFDHHVLDGALAATALADLEDALTGEMVDELDSLPRRETLELRSLPRAA